MTAAGPRFAFLTALAASALAFVSAGTTASGPSLRETLLAAPQTERLAGDGTRPVFGPDAFTFQTPNSPKAHQRPFSFGNRLFNTNWVEAPGSVKAFDGLGPLFNRVSCSGCHTHDGRGAPPGNGEGPADSMLIRLSVEGSDQHGGPKPVAAYGDQLSERAILGVKPEGRLRIRYSEIPGSFGDGTPYSLRQPAYEIADPGYGELPEGLLTSPRVAPAVIGLGFLQAVPDSTILALSDPGDADGDGISGRPNLVWDKQKRRMAVGRFGWKANQPSLRQQNADAAIGDIGISTPLAAGQNCTKVQAACLAAIDGGSPEMSDDFLDRLTLYTMTLAVPAQRRADAPEVREGAARFRDFGCAACHMPTLRTGNVEGFPEISGQTIHPFTDLLLHDMGDGLADGRPDFAASGSEWRTPPLWGLGLVQTVNGHEFLLHDGRARGFEEAILWHGGEAEATREAFRTAPAAERQALIAFLRSL
jgi:CxxC motif-containing protein (DUF1111 family)